MSEGWAFDRLATRRAILFADLVESVRLFQQQEARSFERWHAYVETVRGRIAPACAGHLVRVAGDGLLLDFERAWDATRAALALHEAIGALDQPGEPEGTPFVLRIGLHVADVVANQNDLWGAGVNMAQRLSTLAQPGGTVASAAFRAELGDGVQAEIHDMGERIVKHLTEPVRAFALLPPGQQSRVRLPSTDDLRPAVAVVPFIAMPADAAHDALGHAMADDIIASLARHPGLRVLSRASTAAVRGQALPLRRVRELLGASFLLTGQFYVLGARVCLKAELAALREGEVLWAGSVTSTIDALFEGKDELVPHLVGQVSQHVLAHELARVRSLPMDSLASYSLLLGANGLLHSLVPADFGRAREVLQHLTERHPRQAAPEAMLSAWHMFRVIQGWSGNPVAEGEQVLLHAARATDKEPDSADALVADGVARIFTQRDFDAARARFERALEIAPQHALAWARVSETLSQTGDHESALAAASRAIELSPLDPQRFIYESFAATAAWKIGRYGMATAHARESIRLHTMHAPPHRLLIASLWCDGQQEPARAAVANYLRLMPSARVSASPSASGNGVLQSPFARALLAAGLPP